MDIQRIVAELRGEMDRISHAIGLLEGSTTTKARVGPHRLLPEEVRYGVAAASPRPLAANWRRR